MLIFLSPDLAQAVVVEPEDVLAVQQDLAGRRLMQPVQHPHERGLPGAGESHHDEDLARPHIERHVAHGGDAARLLEELAAGQVRVGGSDDPIRLRPVDLPRVATGNRDARRLWQGRTPRPGRTPRRSPL